MQRRELEELCIVERPKRDDIISVIEVRDFMIGVGNDIVYFSEHGKLWGIVTPGDVLFRSFDGYTKIQKNFTRLTDWSYESAARIFQDNIKIFEIPVVDERGTILGDYCRRDYDLIFYLYNHLLFEANLDTVLYYVYPYIHQITLMKPVRKKNFEIYARMKQILSMREVHYVEASWEDICNGVRDNQVLLFVDLHELKIAQVLVGNELNDKTFFARTYYWLFCTIINSLDYQALQKFHDIVFNHWQDISLYIIRNRCPSTTHFYETFDANKSEKIGVPPEMADFPDIGICEKNAPDVFQTTGKDNYWRDICSHTDEQIATRRMGFLNMLKHLSHSQQEYFRRKFGHCLFMPLSDVRSRYWNVDNGQRKTSGQPDMVDENARKVYMFGDCTIVGALCEDAHTIASFLQSELNRHGWQYRVENCGCFTDGDYELMWHRIFSLRLHKGDVIVIFQNNYEDDRFPCITLPSFYRQYQIPYTWCSDSLSHCNYKVNRLISRFIFNLMQRKANSVYEGKAVCLWDDFWKETYIDRYFHKKTLALYDRVGAITIPNTELEIETKINRAMSQVDFLIIFARSNNDHPNTIYKNIAKIKIATKQFSNLIIVPEAKARFAVKFDKEHEIIEKLFDQQAHWFAKYIACPLNIKKFFLIDSVDEFTNEYNKYLKRILPCYGIETTII